jgi:RNA polymerase sigma-70 factor (ECF subfamily)
MSSPSASIFRNVPLFSALHILCVYIGTMPSQAEFEEAYRQYFDRIFRYFLWQTRNEALSEDLTSDVFSQAWRAWQNFDGKNTQAWLYRIAKNRLIDYWRKKKEISLEEVGDIPHDSKIHEKAERKMEADRIKGAIEELPDNLREVVILRFLEEYSVKEVSETLSISEANVRVLQYRALVKLREVLGNEQI